MVHINMWARTAVYYRIAVVAHLDAEFATVCSMQNSRAHVNVNMHLEAAHSSKMAAKMNSLRNACNFPYLYCRLHIATNGPE